MPTNADSDRLSHLFGQHVAAPFPDACTDRELAGVDLEELNNTAVGCLAPFIGSGAAAVHAAELRRCRDELEIVLPQLAGDSRDYFMRLEKLIQLVLADS